jgi:hypothetical protein
MSPYAYDPQEHKQANFRHFFDKNALTLWAFGIAVLASLMALPALV